MNRRSFVTFPILVTTCHHQKTPHISAGRKDVIMKNKKALQTNCQAKQESNQQSAYTCIWPHSCADWAKTHYWIRRTATNTAVFRSSLSCSRAQTNKPASLCPPFDVKFTFLFSSGWFSFFGWKQTTLFSRWGLFLTYNSSWQTKSLNQIQELGRQRTCRCLFRPSGPSCLCKVVSACLSICPISLSWRLCI